MVNIGSSSFWRCPTGSLRVAPDRLGDRTEPGDLACCSLAEEAGIGADRDEPVPVAHEAFRVVRGHGRDADDASRRSTRVRDPRRCAAKRRSAEREIELETETELQIDRTDEDTASAEGWSTGLITKTRFLSTATPVGLGVLLDRILLLRAGVRLDRLPRGPVAHRDRSARRVGADRRLRIRGRTD